MVLAPCPYLDYSHFDYLPSVDGKIFREKMKKSTSKEIMVLFYKKLSLKSNEKKMED